MQKDNLLSAMINCYRYTHCNVNARTAVDTSLLGGINRSFRNYGREKLSEYEIDLLAFDKECEQFRTNRIKYVSSKYPTFTKLANRLIATYVGAERSFITLITIELKHVLQGTNEGAHGDSAAERCYLVRNRVALQIACVPEFHDFFMHYVKQQFESTYAVLIGDVELNKSSTLLCTLIWLTPDELLKEFKDNIAHFDKFVTASVAQKGLIKE